MDGSLKTKKSLPRYAASKVAQQRMSALERQPGSASCAEAKRIGTVRSACIACERGLDLLHAPSNDRFWVCRRTASARRDRQLWADRV